MNVFLSSSLSLPALSVLRHIHTHNAKCQQVSEWMAELRSKTHGNTDDAPAGIAPQYRYVLNLKCTSYFDTTSTRLFGFLCPLKSTFPTFRLYLSTVDDLPFLMLMHNKNNNSPPPPLNDANSFTRLSMPWIERLCEYWAFVKRTDSVFGVFHLFVQHPLLMSLS